MRFFKQTTFILFCVFSLSFFTFSCSKDDDGGNGGAAASGTMTAKVDGNRVTTMEITTMASLVTQGGVSILTVQGNDSGTSPNKAFYFLISGFEGVGTYDITTPSYAQYIENTVDMNNPTNTETDVWMSGTNSVGGEFKVSEITDSNIKGTFHFKAEHTDRNSEVQVTDGSFDIKLNRY